MPSFVEFFAGGGFARLGLGAAWKCVLANDDCPKKAATYRANFGEDDLKLQDVRTLEPADIPLADLWWASFPCQDHSSAGNRAGFAGDRGSLVFEITRLLEAAITAGTAPKIVAMENVTGFVRANDGRDFTSVMTALVSAGYRVGALMMDARDFVPQARERMILVAVRGGTHPADILARPRHDARWHTKALVKAVAGLPPGVRKNCVWWSLPVPTPHGSRIDDVLDVPGGADQRWLPPAKIAEMMTKVTGRDAVRLEEARRAGRPFAATTSGTRRDTVAGSVRVRTIRTDGRSGCLLTRATTNRQQLMVIEGADVGIRNFTSRELARLIGVPADYCLPRSMPQTVRLMGDGVVVPAVRWLAGTLLEPLLAEGADAAGRPRKEVNHPGFKRVARQRKTPVVAPRAGIKRSTVATTAYFLPEEMERLHAVAAEMGVKLHELMIIGLDAVLARQGKQPVRRYGAERYRVGDRPRSTAST